MANNNQSSLNNNPHVMRVIADASKVVNIDPNDEITDGKIRGYIHKLACKNNDLCDKYRYPEYRSELTRRIYVNMIIKSELCQIVGMREYNFTKVHSVLRASG